MSAVHQGGGSEPLTSSPRSEFTTLSLIPWNEVCGETRNYAASDPRSAREFIRPMLVKIAARNHFPGVLESKKKNYEIGPIGDRSGKVWLGSSGILNFSLSIVTGLVSDCFSVLSVFRKDNFTCFAFFLRRVLPRFYLIVLPLSFVLFMCNFGFN